VCFLVNPDKMEWLVERLAGDGRRAVGHSPAGKSGTAMTLTWMFTRMALMRFSMILFGVSAFVLSLEVITYVDEILKLNDGHLASLGYYALLRLPATLSTFLPISVLLALLLTLTELSYRSELIAIWAAGGSPLQVMLMLLPLGMVLGGLNFLVNDQAAPRAAPVLHEWAIGDYGKKQLALGEQDPIWMRSGNDIVRAGAANDQANELDDVTSSGAMSEGHLIEQIMARRAVLDNGRWQLFDVVVYYPDNLPPNGWSGWSTAAPCGRQRPACVRAIRKRCRWPTSTISSPTRASASARLCLRDLVAQAHDAVVHRLADDRGVCPAGHPVPARRRHRLSVRRSGWRSALRSSLLDGISMTLGEIGLMPPVLAAWLPMLILAAIAAALTVRAEALDRGRANVSG
jgi:lipopolysaccharide export system permease protein